jgi:hypothetical protein
VRVTIRNDILYKQLTQNGGAKSIDDEIRMRDQTEKSYYLSAAGDNEAGNDQYVDLSGSVPRQQYTVFVHMRNGSTQTKMQVVNVGGRSLFDVHREVNRFEDDAPQIVENASPDFPKKDGRIEWLN